VALVNRYEISAQGVTTVPQRYPFAGSQNALVELFVLDLETGESKAMDLGPDDDIYLARVDWNPDGTTLAVQRQSRDQKRLDLIFFDPEAGTGQAVLTETADTWINLHSDLTYLADGGFLWTSERTGFRHLYLYDGNGRLQRQLTRGEWPIAASSRRGGGVRGVDEERNLAFFEASREDVLERHLYSVPLSGGKIRRITKGFGWHETLVSADGRHFVDSFDAPGTPPRTSLRHVDGRLITHIRENPLDDSHPYHPYLGDHLQREYGTLKADDGTELDYWLIKPASFDATHRYPAIVSSYGGPGAQTVAREWAVGFNQLLAQEGFVVFGLDNRGMGNRGKVFENHLYRHMGEVEVRDQVKGAEFLGSQPWVDRNRIGFTGWSYGGYLAVMVMFKAGDVFHAAVAGAPVTDWRLYDTHYTERYLGHPSEGNAYDLSSVFSTLDAYQGNLLIVHGMADDNVVFDHSVKLFEALQKRGLRFEMMTYPGKRHGITGEQEKAHLYRTQLQFFKRHLARSE
jgi:dipeptidyl-peptidase-4